MSEAVVNGPNEWAVLALVAEHPSHGWALATQLARGREIGSIWQVSRPVVYHCLDRLERDGLIRSTGVERGGRGPHRVVFDATPRGRKALRGWFTAPVEHVRDIRSLLLLKVVLAQRAGAGVEPLLVAQRALLLPLVALLESQLEDAGVEASPERTALAFRLESAAATVRFIDGTLDTPPRRGAAGAPTARAPQHRSL